MGPREVPRLWDRHLLNCALLTDLVPSEATVCDVGSGAGLPGLVMAIRRPDLAVTLLEPLLRRSTFLAEVVVALGVEVEVVRARAEELRGREFDVVVSRAVAPLDRLLDWCLPLTRPGGTVLAMKGENAAAEVADAKQTLNRWDAGPPEVVHIGESELSLPTTVVRVEAARGRKLRLRPAGRSGQQRRSQDRSRRGRR